MQKMVAPKCGIIIIAIIPNFVSLIISADAGSDSNPVANGA